MKFKQYRQFKLRLLEVLSFWPVHIFAKLIQLCEQFSLLNKYAAYKLTQ